ncbi:hypothetical protein Tco_1316977 [Tanacetum coccineum]
MAKAKNSFWAIEWDEILQILSLLSINKKCVNFQLRARVGLWSVKSPGPDGFTFEFFRKYWTVVGPDFCIAVKWFFDHGDFAIGCNSSFVALIPKVLDPKVVSDYCPISLIGSLYKVVTKILASRLSLVISDLISDVQTAFLPNRQILDGPFIINEILARCKLKKQQAMIFKVDFQAYLIPFRWDYLDFCFGELGGSHLFGSVLNGVHGFVAVFEVGISKDNRVDPSTTFVSFILRREEKSHLLGVGIPDNCVAEAAKSIGCLIMKAPFKYLGILVGDNMSSKKAWDETINKRRRRIYMLEWFLVLSDAFNSTWSSIITEVKTPLKSTGVDLISIVKISVGKAFFMDSLRASRMCRDILHYGSKCSSSSEDQSDLASSSSSDVSTYNDDQVVIELCHCFYPFVMDVKDVEEWVVWMKPEAFYAQSMVFEEDRIVGVGLEEDPSSLWEVTENTIERKCGVCF